MKTRRQLLKEATDQEDKPEQKKKQTKAEKSKSQVAKKEEKKRGKKRAPSSSSSSSSYSQSSPQVKSKRPAPVQKKEQAKKRVKKDETPQKKQDKNKRGKSKESASKITKSDSDEKPKAKRDSSNKKNLKTVTLTGSVPVDQHFPVKGYHVFQHNGKVYSATLNQTKVKTNNNKFYILQILENDRKSSYYFWTRWGRVGQVGQNGNIECHNKQYAIRLYEEKFREKNVKGDYRNIVLNYEVDSDDDKKDKKDDKKDDNKDEDGVIKERVKDFTQSKLHNDIKNLMKLIFDTDMMDRQMKQIGYDSKKMPLGKLSKDTVLRGYKALKQLMVEIDKKNPSQDKIEQLNNDFYSYIPHDFGHKKMQHFILTSKKQVSQKLEMLQSLENITVARKMLKGNQEDTNIIDQNYAKLDRDMEVVSRTSREFEIIEEYLNNTHASTHASYKLQIESVFRLDRSNENSRYTKNIDNKMLLWHGSRLTNYVGILSQGLRIAPPEAPVTGYMFGKGVYFADMVSKSANYCFTNPTNNTGLLLLCEVALGDMNEKFQADYYADLLPAGKSSTKGVGRTFPPKQSYVELNGVTVPIGVGKTQAIQSSLLYNQYIVYKVQQVKLSYLLRVKFNYRNR